jgi:hypothetical protein
MNQWLDIIQRSVCTDARFLQAFEDSLPFGSRHIFSEPYPISASRANGLYDVFILRYLPLILHILELPQLVRSGDDSVYYSLSEQICLPFCQNMVSGDEGIQS